MGLEMSNSDESTTKSPAAMKAGSPELLQFEELFGCLDPYPQSKLDSVTCPKWADNFGYDSFGAYADILVGSSGQRFRFVKMNYFTTEPDLGIWVGDTLVSQALWIEAKMTNHSYRRGDPDRAVERVTHSEASAFAASLGARLPTLHEFRVMAHGCGVNLNGVIYHPQLHQDHRRGPSSANRFGLFDMYDQVTTWCFSDKYSSEWRGGLGRALGATFSSDGEFICFQSKTTNSNDRSPLIGVRLMKNDLSPLEDTRKRIHA